MKHNIIILNDTSREETHLGCVTVMKNLHYLCAAHNLNVVKSFKPTDIHTSQEYLDALKSCCAVIVNGEGTMHHDGKSASNLFKAAAIAKEMGKKVFLINSVWQENTQLSKKLNVFDRVYVRESLSQMEIEAAGYSADVCPDLSFYKISSNEPRVTKNTDYVFIDSVNNKKSRFIARMALKYRKNFYYMVIPKRKNLGNFLLKLLFAVRGRKLKVLKDHHISGAIITGRFHAMCFALKYNLPFMVMPSNTHKIEGVLSDVGLNPGDFLFSTNTSSEEIHGKISSLDVRSLETELKVKAYVDDAQLKISRMFEVITQDILHQNRKNSSVVEIS